MRLDTLCNEVRALLANTAWRDRGAWATGTGYMQGDIVVQSSIVYVCIEAHALGVFATDLPADKLGQDRERDSRYDERCADRASALAAQHE